jgi:anti-anti-sigma regulatory factor
VGIGVGLFSGWVGIKRSEHGTEQLVKDDSKHRALNFSAVNALDETGTMAVYRLMNELMKAGKTIIVFSNDPKIIKGVSSVLNLNIKPKPELLSNLPPQTSEEV